MIKTCQVRDASIPLKNGAITLGCFDGLHIGHQKVISTLQYEAKKREISSGLYFFSPHPLEVLQDSKTFKKIFVQDEIPILFKDQSLDEVGLIPFDLEFSQMSARDFIHSFLIPQFQPKVVVVGYDFAFGKSKEGSFNDLKKASKEFKFDLIRCEAKLYQEQPCSSSLIKSLILESRMKQVCELLGRPFFFRAPVIKGQGLARKIGWPTCNFKLPASKILPKNGVYKARLRGETRPAVLNIGSKPTFFQDSDVLLELHLIDQDVQLYDKVLEVEIGDFLRPESKFPDQNSLKQQIQKDIEKTFKDFSFLSDT